MSARYLVHTERLVMRWGDMDAMGHVNNTVYFRYMEQARIGFYEAAGLVPGGAELPDNAGPVVVNASCSFLKPLVYPGELEVKVFLSDPGRASVMTHYEIRPGYDPQTLYAEGSAKACFVDRALGRSIPLPDKLRALAGG